MATKSFFVYTLFKTHLKIFKSSWPTNCVTLNLSPKLQKLCSTNSNLFIYETNWSIRSLLILCLCMATKVFLYILFLKPTLKYSSQVDQQIKQTWLKPKVTKTLWYQNLWTYWSISSLFIVYVCGFWQKDQQVSCQNELADPA